MQRGPIKVMRVLLEEGGVPSQVLTITIIHLERKRRLDSRKNLLSVAETSSSFFRIL